MVTHVALVDERVYVREGKTIAHNRTPVGTIYTCTTWCNKQHSTQAVIAGLAGTAASIRSILGGNLVLDIHAHGSPGFISVGSSGISIQNIADVQTWLGVFKWVNIYACSVAGNSEGVAFCRRLAKDCGVWVRASPKPQHDDEKGGVLRIGLWEGDVYTFNPKGDLEWIHRDEGNPIRE
ncbi:MAG: DUF4347 domain-containing protein [Bryobacterales bacterium]|nr:DUF4347 domain-containing protein [Bryobacterales bacterium]